jgi:hypothetical protein
MQRLAVAPAVFRRAPASVRAVVAFALDRPVGDIEVQLALALLWGVGLVQLVWHDQRSDRETDALVEKAIAQIERLANK